MSFSVRAKLLLCCALLMVLCIALSAYGVRSVSKTNTLAEQIYDEALVGVSSAGSAAGKLIAARDMMVRVIAASDGASPEQAKAVRDLVADLGEDLKLVRERVPDESVLQAVGATDASIAEWLRDSSLIVALNMPGVAALPRSDIVEKEGITASANLSDVVGRVAAFGYEMRQRADETMRESRRIMIYGSFGIASVGILIAIILSIVLTTPIRAATELAEHVANGVYVTPVQTSRRDELGRLLNSLAKMQHSLIEREERDRIDIERSKENTSALRVARDKADEAARAKSEFLATMSHEIRSPMSGLVGVIGLLRETSLDPDQARMAAMVHSSAMALLAVLNDILDFSKIEAGALSVNIEPVRMRDLLTDLMQPHILHAADKGIDLTFKYGAELPDCAEVDPMRLRQILNNLLSNAIKFTATGQIALSVDLMPGALPPTFQFAVRDSGIGMSAAVVTRLFEPFMQADGSISRDFGGTGLGLCISERLARMLNGSLMAESREGEGSVFTLLLPLVTASMPAASRSKAALPHNARLVGRGSVLVVDDDLTNRWLSQRQLKLLGLDVDVAEDGVSALEMLRAGRYDLLLTDCHMPRMDGTALTRAVRAAPDPALSGMPIIGLTADVTVAHRQRCFDVGMTDLGYKPLDRDQLYHLLSRHLPNSEAGARDGAPTSAPSISLFLTDATVAPQSDIFTDRFYRELFEPCDPEGPEWLALYLELAESLTYELERLVSAQSDAPIQRDAVKAAAHRLAGNSLSVGATRLGEKARAVERSATNDDVAVLRNLQAAVSEEFTTTKTLMSAFINTAQMTMNFR